MLTDREKKLLYLLGVVVIVTILGLYFYFRTNDLDILNNQIDSLVTNIERIKSTKVEEEDITSRLEEIQDLLKKEQNKFYNPGELELAEFGFLMKQMIKAAGLTEKSARMITTRASQYIDYQLLGSAYNLSRFLKNIATSDKHLSIKEITIKNAKPYDGKSMETRLRIGYETFDSENN